MYNWGYLGKMSNDKVGINIVALLKLRVNSFMLVREFPHVLLYIRCLNLFHEINRIYEALSR
jgi:hypothetical protein